MAGKWLESLWQAAGKAGMRLVCDWRAAGMWLMHGWHVADARLAHGWRAALLSKRGCLLSIAEPTHPTVLKLYPLRETCIEREHADRRTSIRAHKWESTAPVPWPNLYWLVCLQLTRRIGRLEHLGLVRAFERRLHSNEELLARFAVHQHEYRTARWECLSERDRAYVEARPSFVERLRDSGIGGLRFEQQVKCLHVHYSHYLATGVALIFLTCLS